LGGGWGAHHNWNESIGRKVKQLTTTKKLPHIVWSQFANGKTYYTLEVVYIEVATPVRWLPLKSEVTGEVAGWKSIQACSLRVSVLVGDFSFMKP